MVKSEREYRSFELAVREKEEDKEEYIVEGYATTFNDPYVMFTDEDGKEYKEAISSEALSEADMSDVVFLYNHEGRVYARQKNGTLELSCDEHGIKVRADLSKTSESRKMYEDIQAGLIDTMSWAFSVRADEYDQKTHTRTITRIGKVYDVSAVCYPANPNTEISARNYFDGVIEEERRIERERKEMEMRLAIKLKLER